MQAITIVDDSAHFEALKAVRLLGTNPERAIGRLYSSLSDDAKEWVDRLWGKVDHILRVAWDQGAAMARVAIDELGEEIDRLTDALGRQAEQIKAAVKARVSAYLQQLIDSAIAQIREEIVIGARVLKVSKVTVQQNAKFSGSLKLSVEGVCEFVSNGELAISADYSEAKG